MRERSGWLLESGRAGNDLDDVPADLVSNTATRFARPSRSFFVASVLSISRSMALC